MELDSHRGLDFIGLLFFSETMKTIRFAGELLPSWAQMLDVASRLCPVSEPARRWFSRFTGSDGVADARTVLAHCEALLNALHQHRDWVLKELEREGAVWWFVLLSLAGALVGSIPALVNR